MSRLAYAIATTLAVELFATGFVGLAALGHTPRLTWNDSASAPIGLYRLQAGGHSAVGDLVAITPPAPLAALLAERRYLPVGVSLLKHVAALPGDRVCRRHDQITIDGKAIVVARKADSRGRPLPVWRGCRTVKGDEVFLLNCTTDSLDGRYFGPLPAAGLIGRAQPILTRAAPTTPLIWHGFEASPAKAALKKGRFSCS